jgi:hypothetical protein
MNGTYFDADYEVIQMVNKNRNRKVDQAGELPSCKVHFVPETEYARILRYERNRQIIERAIPFAAALLTALACFFAGLCL